jgi:hypothetical protein
MSGVAIVRKLLVDNPALTALVPAARILSGIAPQGTPLPLISVHTISSSEFHDMRRHTRLTRERVQVTVLTNNDYPTMKKALKAANLAPGVHGGTILGFNVRSVLPSGDGPEIPPSDDKIYEQSRDFVVTFTEAN